MKFLRIQRLCLNSIGYSFNNDESRLRRIYSLLIWVSLLIIVIPEWHFVIENISDIPLATDALCTLLTSILSLSKVITVYLRKEKFYHIIHELDEMWLKSSKNDRLILDKGHMIDKRLTLTYFISAMAVAVLYLIYPIFKATYELQTIGSTIWIMPMRSTFLYDVSVSPNYELTYLWFVQCTYLAAVGSVGVDCLFYGGSFNISSHFQIIQKKIRNATFEQTIVENGTRMNKRVLKEFSDVVQYHQKVLSICDEFAHLYSAVLFTQFLITSVLLCVIAFQLTLVG